MDNFISDFLKENEVKPAKEHENSASATISSNNNLVITGTNPPVSGKLLIAACNDWDHCGDKNVSGGLDEYHLINLEATVKNAFTSSSSRHTFFLLNNDTVYALGVNDEGQLGVGHLNTVHFPVKVTLPIKASKVIKIATGRYHSIMLFENGEIYGCGGRKCGQLSFGSARPKDQFIWTKIPTTLPVVDIACGYEYSVYCDTNGHVYTFGHPEYGQLGNGTTGEYIAKAGRVEYHYVTTPTLVSKYVTKDAYGKTTQEITADDIKIVAVSAGRNHTLFLEEYFKDGVITSDSPLNRVYSCGMGGYGRLGHSCANNEVFPREITFFSHYLPKIQGGSQVPSPLKQKQIREIIAGNTVTYAVSESRHLYYWGQSTGSKEAPTYPRIQAELYDYPVRSLAVGNCVTMVASDHMTIAWGRPVSGKFGFSDNASSSVNPREVTALQGLKTLVVSAGYAHVCVIVYDDSTATSTVTNTATTLPSTSTSSTKKISSISSSKAKDTKDSTNTAESVLSGRLHELPRVSPYEKKTASAGKAKASTTSSTKAKMNTSATSSKDKRKFQETSSDSDDNDDVSDEDDDGVSDSGSEDMWNKKKKAKVVLKGKVKGKGKK